MNISLQAFLQGTSIGLALAIPIGPVGFLCIQRSLRYGRLIGFISALGVATADAICASIAVFGLSFGYSLLDVYQNQIKLVGGIFLLILGIKNLLYSESFKTYTILEKVSFFNTYLSALLITIANPITILLFLGVFSGLELNTENSNIGRFMLVFGVLIGSLIWFSSLTSIVAFLRSKFSENYLKYINIVSSVIIIGFGVYSLLTIK